MLKGECVSSNQRDGRTAFRLCRIVLGSHPVYGIPVQQVDRTRIPKRRSTCPFPKPFPIFIGNTSGESNLAKTDALVHPLRALCP